MFGLGIGGSGEPRKASKSRKGSRKVAVEAGVRGRSRARRGRLEAGRGRPGLASNKPDPGCRAILCSQLFRLWAGPECSRYTRKVGQNGGDPDRVNMSGEGSCLAPSSLAGAFQLPECSLGSCPPHPHPHPLHSSVPGKGCGHSAGAQLFHRA